MHRFWLYQVQTRVDRKIRKLVPELIQRIDDRALPEVPASSALTQLRLDLD